MSRVVFQDRFGEDREIGTCDSEQEAFKIIKRFLDDHNFKCYYMRTCEVENSEGSYTWVDVGSHVEFFKIYH